MVIERRPVWMAFLLAFFGFSATIIIHESGHFFVALLFGLPVEVFSLGFGPALVKFTLGSTAFQLALLPFGGYVSIDPAVFSNAPLIAQYSIAVAGIIFNLVLAYLIFMIFSWRKREVHLVDEEIIITTSDVRLNLFSQSARLFVESIKKLHELTLLTLVRSKKLIAGPITIIKGLIEMAKNGIFLYLLSIALLNINLAFFNMLPLPFLDGGRLVQTTVEAFFGQQPFSVMAAISLFIFFLLITILSYMQQYKMQRNSNNVE